MVSVSLFANWHILLSGTQCSSELKFNGFFVIIIITIINMDYKYFLSTYYVQTILLVILFYQILFDLKYMNETPKRNGLFS